MNLYNNMWNTDYPYWVEGSWRSRVRLWPTAKATDAAVNLAVRSREARVPLLAAVASGPAVRFAPKQGGLNVSRSGVLVTAFGENPDGAGTLLRVWEQSGAEAEFSVTLPAGAKFKTATPVNLRCENTGSPFSIRTGRFSFNLAAFAPANFLLD